jgi:hypothetical protein
VSTLEEWTVVVSRELGVEDAVDPDTMTKLVLDLARDVAHGVARPAAPLTTYLVGVAVGRRADADAGAALPAVAAEIAELARGWSADRPGPA